MKAFEICHRYNPVRVKDKITCKHLMRAKDLTGLCTLRAKFLCDVWKYRQSEKK